MAGRGRIGNCKGIDDGITHPPLDLLLFPLPATDRERGHPGQVGVNGDAKTIQYFDRPARFPGGSGDCLHDNAGLTAPG